MAKQLQASLTKMSCRRNVGIFRLFSLSEVSLYIQSHNISVAAFKLFILAWA